MFISPNKLLTVIILVFAVVNNSSWACSGQALETTKRLINDSLSLESTDGMGSNPNALNESINIINRLSKLPRSCQQLYEQVSQSMQLRNDVNR